MARYKLLHGTFYQLSPNADELRPHDQGRHIRRKRGDVFESELDLENLFQNKFVKVTEAELAPVSDERKKAVDQLIKSGACEEGDRQSLEQLTESGFGAIMAGVLSRRTVPEATKEEEPKNLLGEDVTDDFPEAAAKGFKVFRSPANKYNVTRAEDASKVLNPAPLKKGQVEGNFISDYLEEMGQ